MTTSSVKMAGSASVESPQPLVFGIFAVRVLEGMFDLSLFFLRISWSGRFQAAQQGTLLGLASSNLTFSGGARDVSEKES